MTQTEMRELDAWIAETLETAIALFAKEVFK